jgi:hypothetical protein
VPKIRVTSAVIKCRNWSPTAGRNRQQGKVAQPADHGSQRVDTADGDVQPLVSGRGQRERPEQPERTETDVDDVVVRIDQEDPEKLVIGHLGDLGGTGEEETDNAADDVDGAEKQREVLLERPAAASEPDTESFLGRSKRHVCPLPLTSTPLDVDHSTVGAKVGVAPRPQVSGTPSAATVDGSSADRRITLSEA